MESEPLVYIILVNYNGMADTIECIQSLQKITYKNYNIIIVDNNSEDAPIIVERVATYVNVEVILSTNNLGFSHGNNIGIERALKNGAKYCLLLNNDTIVDPEFLTQLVNVAETHNDTAIVTGKILFLDDIRRKWYAGGVINYKSSMCVHLEYNELDDQSVIESKEMEISFATGCLMLLTQQALSNIGMLNEEFFMYAEDLDYSWDIIDSGLKIYYTPNAVIYHKVSASTGKSSRFTQYYMSRNQFYIIQKHIEPKKRIVVFIRFLLLSGKRIINGDLDLSVFFCATVDAIKGIKGKVAI